MKMRSIKELVDQIIEDGKITKEEQQWLNMSILADGKVSPDEKEQIERLFELITSGKVQAVP